MIVLGLWERFVYCASNAASLSVRVDNGVIRRN